MELTINGTLQTLPDGLRVCDLPARLGLNPSTVAVEVNKRLIPRRLHAETVLHTGDAVEIVTLVGGG